MIRYKLIERERFQDAPFVGCLISAIGCSLNCVNCFNQHIKEMDTLYINTDEIVDMIKNNPFEEGLILGGLEWSEQSDELIELVNTVMDNNLKVMIYTGLTEIEFFNIVDKSKLQSGVYIKFGRYINTNKTITNIQFGVNLASENQYIKIIN